MKNKLNKRFKNGIAMIELIFALVIIGIVLLSAPMLIQQSINSGYVSLQQEAIAAASSHAGILVGKHWDEGDANNTTGVAPIITLNTQQPNSPFTFGGIVDINTSSRTSAIVDNNISASPIGTDGNETTPDLYDDIDDYNNKDLNLTIFNGETTTADIGEYVDQNITIKTIVTFANDRNKTHSDFNNSVVDINNIYLNRDLSGVESNIKFIHINLTTKNTTISELEKNITLDTFSCNLGTYILGEGQF